MNAIKSDEEIINNLPQIPNSVLLKVFIKENQQRRAFSKEEDQRLLYLVDNYGKTKWEKIAELMPFRSLRQCKERYEGYLSPCINHNKFTNEEDSLIIEKYKELGTKWTKIAKFFKGRSGNQIKNRFNTYLKNKNFEKNQINNEKFKKEKDCNFDLSHFNHSYFNDFDNFDKFDYDDFDEELFFVE